MTPAFWRDSIEVIRAPLVTDEYGTSGAARDWENAVTVTVSGCSVQPESFSEYPAEGREASVTRWRVFTPPGADIRAGDRIRYAGALFEVDGDGMAWPSASGCLDHVEARIKRVEG